MKEQEEEEEEEEEETLNKTWKSRRKLEDKNGAIVGFMGSITKYFA